MAAADKYVLELDSWCTPATSYPEQELGNFRIHRGQYRRGLYEMHGIDDFIFFQVVKPIPITYLEERRGKRWHSWMLDDPPHWRAMEIYANNAKGKVLVAGLGLGLYLQALKENKDVERVTVVEQSSEVVQLMESHLPTLPGFSIALGDFYEFLDKDFTSWDTILVDLWVTHGPKEKLEVYWHKVLPLAASLKLRYPRASITFHGFSTVSDIQFASQEIIDKIVELKGAVT